MPDFAILFATTGAWSRSAVPAVIFGQLWVLYLAGLAFSSRWLPERLACGFTLLGRPQTWASRPVYLLGAAVLGTLLPFCMVGTSLWGSADPRHIHVPNGGYWLTPEHWPDARAYAVAHSFWLACMMVCFLAAVNVLILLANRRTPPRLSLPLLLLVVGCFGAGVTTWAITLEHHYKNVKTGITEGRSS